MFYFVLTIHLLLCVVLIGLVLLQQGKGAAAGALLSGSSNTLFGAAGANTVLTKATTGVAVAFFVSSIALIKVYGGYAPSKTVDPLAGSVVERQAAVEQQASAPASAGEAAPSGESAPAGESGSVQPEIPAPVAQGDVSAAADVSGGEKPASK